jgi:hypothetical protein
MKFAGTLTICFILAACSRVPEIDRANAGAIIEDAKIILVDAPIGPLESFAWPNSFNVLSPKSVRVAEEGLYIVTYSFFVEESGVFVARELAEFDWEVSPGPSFLQIKDGLFEYHFTG